MSDEMKLVAKAPLDYNEAQELYERACDIMRHLRGGSRLLHSEMAALHAGFHTFKGDRDLLMAPEWDLIGQAGQLALEGMGIKRDELRKCTDPMPKWEQPEDPAGG
jgi:hypothetical protein